MTGRRPVPVLATIIVLAAVATMIGLGFWQLQRAEWKASLLARYAAAGEQPPAQFPISEEAVEQTLYRRAFVTCERVISRNAEAGKNAEGIKGLAQVARCALVGGGQADIVLGYSRTPELVDWAGGTVGGIIGPGRGSEARLVADPPQAGLAANAMPDPRDLPNNHTGYAWQWFFFALTALVIYWLALRKRRGDASAS